MNLIPAYIDWHYFEIWPKLFLFWRNITLFPFYYFSIPLHLKTLFAPWKRQRIKPNTGFNLARVLSAISFNITSRCIGLVIRIITILCGTVIMLIFSIFFFPFVLVWPVIPGISLLFYIFRKPTVNEEAEFLLAQSGGDLRHLTILLFNHRIGLFITARLGLDHNQIIAYLHHEKDTGDFGLFQKKIALNRGFLTLTGLFAVDLAVYQPLRVLLQRNSIKIEDFLSTADWYCHLQITKPQPLIFDLNRIRNINGIGVSWAYGYTVQFDKLSDDLTKHTPRFPLLVGRDKEIAELEQTLLKTEANNVLIVGDPGVSRHILVETLAHRIFFGLSSSSLAHKRILKLDMHAVISAIPSIPEVKGLAAELLAEAEYAGNIIVVIDEIDKYTSNDSGRIDLSDVLAKFASSSMGVIGITTPYGYHKYIEPNSSITLFFTKIEMAPPAKEIVLREMEISIVPELEKKYHLYVTHAAIQKIIDDADRYISATPFPAKAIELLDEVCLYSASQKKGRLVLPCHVDEFLTQKLHMHIGELQREEKEKLLHLEDLLHAQIINQEEAIRVLASALRRNRLDVSAPNKPIGSFLFLGPTGVGKTETSKALAGVYFGSEKNMIRFDMSQYQKDEGLERLIGSVKLGIPGELTSKLRDQPFSLLLLDEFEKSEKGIYNLFFTLIDEGYIKDSLDRTVDAKNTIIIATSNAGAEFIRERVNQGITGNDLQKELIEYVQKEKIFSPELINRFDAVVVYTPLSEGHLREIANLMLTALNKRLIQKKISVNITPDLIKQLALIGFDPQFGARSMRRTITENIEDQIAQQLLKGTVKPGEQINIQL